MLRPRRSRALALSDDEPSADLQDGLDLRLEAYAIDKSAAMRRFASEGPTRDAATELARQYYPVCLEFPLFLAAAISHVRDERTRLLLVANLYEEHGDLDPSRTHPALFRRYVEALGMDSGALAVARSHSPGANLAARFRTVCQQGPDVRAIAILYAFEALFSPACAMIARGLRRIGLPQAGIEFFDVHAVADVSHAAQLRESLSAACRSDAEWRLALDTAGEGARLLYELFDAVATAPSS